MSYKRFDSRFNTLAQADLHFIKSIKKRLNVREVKDDPEFSKHDADYEKYSRENLFLYALGSLWHGVALTAWRYIMTKKI
jgi:hypothetical protein